MRIKDENKRIAIMAASIELINEIGFAQTSMSKIAKEAKVSPATIYTYFENKEDLLNNLYIMVSEKMTESIFSGLDNNPDIKEAFTSILKNTFFYLKGNLSDFLFMEQFCNSPLINKFSKEEVEKQYIPICELLERGKREGIFKDYSTELLGTCVLTPIFKLSKYTFDDENNSDTIIAQAIEIAWDGIVLHK